MLDAREPSWNGWSVDAENSRFVPTVVGRLTVAQIPRLRLKWAFGFPGETLVRGQPTIFGGRIYVGSGRGIVYSLNRQTGCIYWTFKAAGEVRTAPVLAEIQEHKWAVFFGDARGYVYAVDARFGNLIWKKQADPQPNTHITGSPRIYKGILYTTISSNEEGLGADPSYPCCKFRGSVVAMDAKTGKQKWLIHTIAENPQPTRVNKKGTQLWGPSGAPIWSTVTVDEEKKRIYVVTGNNYSDPATDMSDAILSMAMNNGTIEWSQQITSGDAYNIGCDEGEDNTNCPKAKGPDFDFGSPPILVKLSTGKRLLIASQKSGVVTALDPDERGRVVWQTRVGKGGDLGGIQWGAASDGKKVYAAVSDIVSKEIRVEGQEVTMALDPQKGGGLYALKLETGKIIWQVLPDSLVCNGKSRCSPAQSAPVTAISGVIFSGSVDGHLRAYATEDGRLLWDTNTAHEFETVNHLSGARGGSIDSAGPVVVGGTLYVVSGYDTWGGMPGNILLAFEAP